MEEQENLKNKLIKSIIYNLVGFAILFIIFGFFIFLLLENITFNNVNRYLYETKEQILELDSEKIDFWINSSVYGNVNRNDWVQNALRNYQDKLILSKISNPNIIVILRDSTGKIINESELFRFNDYIENSIFNSKVLDEVYEIKIGNSYFYKGLNFVFEGNGIFEDRYVQLLINIDGEKNLVNSYFQIISASVVVGIICAIFVSYIIAERNLKPLHDNIIKQMEFVQNVSHELRTPLTIIQAKQELLLQEPNSKIIDKSEDIILTLNETKRLSKLVKDLMLLSRADSKKITLQKENTNIDDFIKELSIPYQEIAEMQGKSLNLNLNYKIDIDVDTNKIYQLMIILLDNAIKYTEENDSIEIKTYSKDNKCVIEVKDTGIGISDEGLKRIFERFYREDQARNRETGGSGLGLSIANYIVTAHNGTIKATHNEPKGSVFTIRIPK